MVRTQISLDENMYRAARNTARRQGISFAELVRRALTAVLPETPDGAPWLRFAGIVDGEADDSQQVDEVVYGRERP